MAGTTRIGIASLLVLATACSRAESSAATEEVAGIDSLNARLARAYRVADPQAYAALFTDSAVFEWPAFNTVRGRVGMAAMASANWATLRDMDLLLSVSSRRVRADQATEFGAFQQLYRDSSGARMTEFGRYVAYLVRGSDGDWRIDRFFGFADSTRTQAPPPQPPNPRATP